MSDLDVNPAVRVCGGRAEVTAKPVHELLSARNVPLGESTRVRRLLPNLGRRMVGAWCFVDHYGPDNIVAEPGMQVPPHPHTGLQTVSWLRAGEVLHRDSLGSTQMIRPGELGLMTAGSAISHAEQSPPEHSATLHGAQLWVALPGSARHIDPQWEHHADLPVITSPGLRATVIMGELAGVVSPGTTHTPLVGAQLLLDGGADRRLPIEPDFEYAVMVMSGHAEVCGVMVEPGSLLYLGCGRSQLRLRSDASAELMLLGGEPFEERIVMWWNFVARTGDEVKQARREWMEGNTFGTVTGYDGEPLPAPAMPDLPLKPRGRQR